MTAQLLASDVLRNASYSAKQTMRANAVGVLVAANPKLVQAGPKESSLTAAAKNIRIELKAAFPSIKFSVKTSRFSMGDSIGVSWTDGPNTDQVNSIVNRYKAGSFDGMTDCYNYESCAWTDAFGDSKYISTYRDYSDKMLLSVMGRVCRWLGGMDKTPTVEDYRQGRLWNFKQSGGCDVQREIGVALSRHTYSITRGQSC